MSPADLSGVGVIDCTSAVLPDTVRIDRCPRIDGFGLYARAAFAPGERVYPFEYSFHPVGSFRLLTDFGAREGSMTSDHGAEIMGPWDLPRELSYDLLERLGGVGPSGNAGGQNRR